MKVAEQISDLLSSAGVRTVFGNPGTTELPFLEGLRIPYYLTLHDAISVGAADGQAQVRRSVAVANLHAAPGLGNSIAFIDSARRNRSPVLVTVGQQDLRHLDQRPLLSGDFESMVRGLVKFFGEVHQPSEVTGILDTAMRQAMQPPMGPVLVSLPMNVMELSTSPGEVTRPSSEPGPAGSLDVVEGRIRSASDPVLVVGYEVDLYRVHDRVEALAKRLGAPIYAEPICSRAPISADSPAFVGDLLPQSAILQATLGLHDLVILVGADLTLYPYSAARLLRGDRVVYLGADPSVPEKLDCPSATGDLDRLLDTLLANLPASGRTFSRPVDLSRANRVARAAGRMGPDFVIDAVHRLYSDHTIVDESVSLIPTVKSFGFYRGADSYFSSRSQQLGWGLAASIGIALERPKTAVVIGDGALEYSVQALWTLARYRLPVKVIVVNNGGYSILKSYAKANHPSVVDAEFLDLPGLDVERIARAYGMPATTVEAPAALDRALIEAREADGPSLVNVVMDRTVPDLFS